MLNRCYKSIKKAPAYNRSSFKKFVVRDDNQVTFLQTILYQL